MQRDANPGNLSAPITTINSYSYSGNSPNFYVDPSGNVFFTVVADFALAGAVGNVVENGLNFDNLLAGAFRGALIGSVWGAAFTINALVTGLTLFGHFVGAARTEGNFFTNFALSDMAVRNGFLALGLSAAAGIDAVNPGSIFNSFHASSTTSNFLAGLAGIAIPVVESFTCERAESDTLLADGTFSNSLSCKRNNPREVKER